MKSKTRKTSDVRGWMALDNVTSHFPTMLEPIASASFLSSLGWEKEKELFALRKHKHKSYHLSLVLEPFQQEKQALTSQSSEHRLGKTLYPQIVCRDSKRQSTMSVFIALYMHLCFDHLVIINKQEESIAASCRKACKTPFCELYFCLIRPFSV